MGLPWVQGLIRGRMQGGRIAAQVVERRLGGPGRPRTFEESGAVREVYERLRARDSSDNFEFETLGFLGGAVAWLLPSRRLALPVGGQRDRLTTFNCEPLSDLMYVALMRNLGAPTIWFCAEPAGGMQEDPEIDWLFDLLDEGLELGVHNSYGWMSYRLPDSLQRYQMALYKKQAEWWNLVRPGFPCIVQSQITFPPVGDDTLDGESGIICPCLPAGEFSFLKVAMLSLEGAGWQLCDLECRRTGKGWQPLNRKVVGILPREEKSPMLYQFGPDGALDQCGPHFPLSGEVVEYVLSHLSIPLLGPHGLDWLMEAS